MLSEQQLDAIEHRRAHAEAEGDTFMVCTLAVMKILLASARAERRLREAIQPLAALADNEADGEFWIGHSAAVAARAALAESEAK